MRFPISLLPLTLGDSGFRCASRRYYSAEVLPHTAMPSTHIHDCYELYFVLSGDVSFLVGDRVYPLESGDIILVPPEEVHVCLLHSPGLYEAYCFWFLPDRATALTEFCRGEPRHHLRFPKEIRDRLTALIPQLCHAEEAGRELERTACVYQLLALLNGSAQPEELSIPALLPESLQQVLSFLNTSIAQVHTVESLAEHFYISTATLNRWFRTYLRISPKAYLESRRLSCSKALLIQGLSVTEVSLRAGFPSCSRFISVFREAFGMTPLQYQKQHIR